jgi:hypothetical protein
MRRTGFIVLLAVSLLVALFCAGYPLYVIRPFRHQGAGELRAALFVLQYRNPVLLLTAAISVLALAGYWRSGGRFWPRLFSGLATLLVLASAAISRVNIYERMFHPAGKPAFESASSTHLDGSEKVIAVKIGDAARAYPIRSISYHHIVNDVVGGKPIVSTY